MKRKSAARPALAALAALCAASLLAAPAAHAQAEPDDEEEEAPRRTRIGLGPQFVPSFPGSDELSLLPLFELSRTRGDQPFAFEAPDQSTGFTLVDSGGFAFGPVIGFEGSRDPDDVGAALPKVKTTVELGGFAQYELGPSFRIRSEVRRGLGGHDGLIANLSADYVARGANDQQFSIGPRVTLANDRYHDAYFSVTPASALATGLAAYDADGGVQAIGAAAGFITQFSPRWGIYSYAKYDRLVGDAADSPIVRELGSRDQFSGGIALTYTFGRGVD